MIGLCPERDSSNSVYTLILMSMHSLYFVHADNTTVLTGPVTILILYLYFSKKPNLIPSFVPSLLRRLQTHIPLMIIGQIDVKPYFFLMCTCLQIFIYPQNLTEIISYFWYVAFWLFEGRPSWTNHRYMQAALRTYIENFSLHPSSQSSDWFRIQASSLKQKSQSKFVCITQIQNYLHMMAKGIKLMSSWSCTYICFAR